MVKNHYTKSARCRQSFKEKNSYKPEVFDYGNRCGHKKNAWRSPANLPLKPSNLPKIIKLCHQKLDKFSKKRISLHGGRSERSESELLMSRGNK